MFFRFVVLSLSGLEKHIENQIELKQYFDTSMQGTFGCSKLGFVIEIS